MNKPANAKLFVRTLSRMEIQLKIGQITKIISLIPKAFHATQLTVGLTGSSRPTDIKIYFSDGMKDLENKNFDDLPYIQFKSDPGKSKTSFKPVYNNLEAAHTYCFIETDKPAAVSAEVTLHYEGR